MYYVKGDCAGKGQVVVFNRSHYEDVLVVRVHKRVPKDVWSKRYELINDFEQMLAENRTRIVKFYLQISPEEQLARFKQRLDDQERHWKINEADYSERELWPDYIEAFEEALEKTSTKACAVVRYPVQSQMVPQPVRRRDSCWHPRRHESKAAAHELGNGFKELTVEFRCYPELPRIRGVKAQERVEGEDH
jgi:hypothetical protein